MSLGRSFCSPGIRRTGLLLAPAPRRPLFHVQGHANAIRRWETTTTGDDKSGHINAPAAGEGILFLDNVFPLRIGNLLAWRPWRTSSDGYNDADIAKLLKRFQPKAGSGATEPSSSLLAPLVSFFDPVSLVQRAIPPDLSVTVTEIVPRLKDGGVFVKFRQKDAAAEAGAGSTTAATPSSAADLEARLAKRLADHPVRPWFNPFWGCMRAGLVRGVPWLEDLASRIPSSRVRVEFCVPAEGTAGDATGGSNLELSQETLYSLFRRYGKIAEITGQPSESKTLPRFAIIDFLHVRDAIMARSCLHGYVVGGTTRLSLAYEARVRAHHIWDWLTSHPRIVIPILAALLAAVTVAVFDPIRTFFIRAHVHHSFVLHDNSLYKWLQRRTAAAMDFARSSYGAAADNIGLGGRLGRSHAAKGGSEALMSHRRDLLESLHTWLLETAGTFIVVQGPRGSGKSELVVDQALHGRHDVLVIDCKPLAEARGESATIKKLAGAVGYRPVFSWANNLSSLIDLAVQGTTGVKTGFSETLDEQVAKILQTATVALRDVSLAARNPKTDVDGDLNDDAYLEAHPERRAVIVLRNFGGSGGGSSAAANGPLYDKLAEWAATLVTANIAHVVFLTTDTGYPKSLVKAMPDRIFRQIALGDLSPPVAMNYVLGHLAAKDAVDEDDDGSAADPDAQQQLSQPEQQSQAQKDIAPEETKQPSLLALVEKKLPFGKKEEKAEDAEGAKPLPPPPRQQPPDTQPSNQAATAAASLSSGPASSPAAVARAARLYAQKHPETIRELESCIGVLGGRLTDLESLVRRLKSGQSPQRAVSEIVEQSASEIIKMFLLVPPGRGGAGGAGGGAKGGASASSGSGSAASRSAPAGSAGSAGSSSGGLASAGGSGSRAWTPEQAWYLVRELGALSGSNSRGAKAAPTATPSLQYSKVLLSDVFSAGGMDDAVAAIDALAAAEFIIVKSSSNGRPQSIRAGRPVYEAAFAHLRADRPLAARLDRNLLTERTALETKKISKCEAELAVLSSLQLLRLPSQTMERAAYLLKKLEASQAKIVAYEAEMALLGKVMADD